MGSVSGTTDRSRLIRVGGIAVILALAIHIYANGFLKTFPPTAPTATELERYLALERGTWAIVHGIKYVALVGLVLFAAAVHARIGGGRDQGDAGWGIVGLLGAGIHVANALIANGIEVFAFYDFSRLSEDPNLFWLVFHMVRVLFTAEIVAWGVFIFGFSMAGHQTGRLPRWLNLLGFGGAGAYLIAAAFVVSVLDGGWASPVMDAASLAGLAWFASVGLYITLRGDA